ncbi:MAG: DNA-processing protein DprA [Vicinamibacteria bacterium]|nr:DNA-processing protein DprA [Vicinamibacteria bacterium]
MGAKRPPSSFPDPVIGQAGRAVEASPSCRIVALNPTTCRSDAADWLRLCHSPGLAPAALRQLLRAFGTPTAVLAAAGTAVHAVAGPEARTAIEAGPPMELVDSTLSWLEGGDRHLLALGDESYPRALLQIFDPPPLLYVLGDTARLNEPSIAIVGSRNATKQGLSDARGFARTLSAAGFCIVSGLALGIDAAAHRGGLAARSSSIAVVGTGLDRIYPAANRELAHDLAARGAIVSEFCLGTPPVASNFPRRNRLIAGLSRGVLVVEAAMKSGSLTTARLALEQGRDVFAVPGSIHSPLSKGCHWLLKQGAKLVESADDVLAEWGIMRAPVPDFPEPDERSGTLLAELGHAPATLDALVSRTGRPAPELSAEFTQLELDGRVERLPGGLYRRLDARS